MMSVKIDQRPGVVPVQQVDGAAPVKATQPAVSAPVVDEVSGAGPSGAPVGIRPPDPQSESAALKGIGDLRYHDKFGDRPRARPGLDLAFGEAFDADLLMQTDFAVWAQNEVASGNAAASVLLDLPPLTVKDLA